MFNDVLCVAGCCFVSVAVPVGLGMGVVRWAGEHPWFEGATHLVDGVAVVGRVLDQQVLEGCHGDLPHLGAVLLLQGARHLAQQQAHQEVVPAVVLGQAALQVLVWGEGVKGQRS